MGPTVLGIAGEHKRGKKQKKKKRGRGQRAGFAQFGEPCPICYTMLLAME
jgi:hypothetical protein